ncbi:UNVERIFIED_CONTAM: hypothetical protein FKN15_069360 [Acipenser sinensis]
MRRDGKDKSEKHEFISEPDLQKLKTSGILATNEPRGLLYKVRFDIELHFACRGRGLRALPATAFKPKLFSPENTATQPIWYTCKPLGKNMIGNVMATLSEKAMLSKRYTNHCIRATTVQLLSDSGLETREIMSVTGHCNEGSIRSYWTANQQERHDWSTTPPSKPASQTANPVSVLFAPVNPLCQLE